MNIFMRFDFFVPETMPQNKATSRKIQLYRILTQNQQDDKDGYRVVWFLLRGGPDSGDGGRRPPRLLKSQIKHSYIYSHQSAIPVSIQSHDETHECGANLCKRYICL